MKLTLLLFSLFPLLCWGQNTQANPLTVSQALAKTDNSSTSYWVEGYIVGEISAYSNNKFFYEMAPPFNGDIAYLIADSPLEYDLKKCMPIQFPGNSMSEEMALDIKGIYWRKKVQLKGLLRDYMTLPGLKSITEHCFLDRDSWKDETQQWNFYEDMDSRDYQATSSSSVFAGGVYTGAQGAWKIIGGTYGDTGNDNKWDRASIRLRLTEGTSGEKGSMTMSFDKPNGIGELRFWAGNYQEDASKTAAFSVFYSIDAGANWTPVVENQIILRGNAVTTNGMSEYRFIINQQGNIRIRMTKADNTTAGINIDKLRMSDYVSTSSTKPVIGAHPFRCYGVEGSLVLESEVSQSIEICQLNGLLVKRLLIAAGKTQFSLPAGVYLVRTNSATYKILL